MIGSNHICLGLLLLFLSQFILLIAASDYAGSARAGAAMRGVRYSTRSRKRRSVDYSGSTQPYTPPPSTPYTPPPSTPYTPPPSTPYTPPPSTPYTPPPSTPYTPPPPPPYTPPPYTPSPYTPPPSTPYYPPDYGNYCQCPGSPGGDCTASSQPMTDGKNCVCTPTNSPPGCTPPPCTSSTSTSVVCVCTTQFQPQGCIRSPPCSNTQGTGTMNVLGVAKLTGINEANPNQLGLAALDNPLLHNKQDSQMFAELLPGSALLGNGAKDSPLPLGSLPLGNDALPTSNLLNLDALPQSGSLPVATGKGSSLPLDSGLLDLGVLNGDALSDTSGALPLNLLTLDALDTRSSSPQIGGTLQDLVNNTPNQSSPLKILQLDALPQEQKQPQPNVIKVIRAPQQSLPVKTSSLSPAQVFALQSLFG